MKIIVSAESTIDLPKDLLNRFGISTIPFTVTMGDDDFLDGEIVNTQIFDFVDQNKILPKTSAVNQFQYEEYFGNLKKDNDAVIHISLSSELSCTYNNAVEASKNFENVFVVDSKTLSTGIALLAMKASDLIKKGLSVVEIVNIIKETVPKVQASFILDKLTYLHKGGRCSGVATFSANLLSIKPQIVLSNGKMIVGKKYVGKLDALTKKYCNDVLSACPKVDKTYAFVTCTTATLTMLESAKNSLKEKGFKEIFVTYAGATISSHCGPNTLGILFIKE